MRYLSAGYAAQDLYTCPLACSERLSADELRSHVIKTASAAISTMRRQYAASGLSDRASYAADSIAERYAALYREAVPGPVSDWRDSDGLRGYADRTVRVVS